MTWGVVNIFLRFCFRVVPKVFQKNRSESVFKLVNYNYLAFKLILIVNLNKYTLKNDLFEKVSTRAVDRWYCFDFNFTSFTDVGTQSFIRVGLNRANTVTQ